MYKYIIFFFFFTKASNLIIDSNVNTSMAAWFQVIICDDKCRVSYILDNRRMYISQLIEINTFIIMKYCLDYFQIIIFKLIQFFIFSIILILTAIIAFFIFLIEYYVYLKIIISTYPLRQIRGSASIIYNTKRVFFSVDWVSEPLTVT